MNYKQLLETKTAIDLLIKGIDPQSKQYVGDDSILSSQYNQNILSNVSSMIDNMIKYGLVDFVYNGKKINDIIYKFYENADVISAGKDISDPLDILQSSRFNDLLINMEQVYDYIILDSSSLSESLDSQVLAEKAGGTIIVVEGESTSREVVNESIKLIKECGGNLFGLVFNKEDKKHVRK